MNPSELSLRLAERTLELVSIPSVTGDEGWICERILALCRELAPGAELHRVGNSVIALGPAVAGRPNIALFGHLDTVRPALDQPLKIDEGRVFGCGASDMKGALAVMLELLGEADALDRANLIFVFYDREEGPMEESGLIPVLASGLLPPMDLALCLEPTDNRIQAGCVGGIHARVTVSGQRAHSARPWQGDNAVARAIPLLTRVAAFGRREVRFGELSFYEVMSVTQAATFNSRNVVPDRLELNVNYRYAPGRSADSARAELEAVLIGPDPEHEYPHGLSIELVDEAPSGAVHTDQPLLKAWREEKGIALEAKQAWTDVARLTQAGVPAVNFGPGETAQAHQARESVPVAMLERGYELLRALPSSR